MTPLYGALPFEAQVRAVAPATPGRRKVVLATSIAETSLTIEDVRAVVDGGPVAGSSIRSGDGDDGARRRLGSAYAQAEQRRGRAGRVAPGRCYRPWAEEETRALSAFAPPEIAVARTSRRSRSISPPGDERPGRLRPARSAAARGLCPGAGAAARARRVDARARNTPHGRATGAAGAASAARAYDPAGRRDGPGRDGLRLGRGLVRARRAAGRPRRAALRSAGAAGRDWPRRAAAGRDGRSRRAPRGRARTPRRGRDRRGSRPARSTPTQRVGCWRSPIPIASRKGGARAGRSGCAPAAARGCPRRTRWRASRSWPSARSTAVATTPASSWPRRSRSPRSRRRSPTKSTTSRRCAGTRGDGAVVARRMRRLGALMLAERRLDAPPADAVAAAMAEGLRALGLARLPWTPALRQLQSAGGVPARARRRDVGDPADGRCGVDRGGRGVGPHYLDGMTRAAHLDRFDLDAALKARLGWETVRRLDAQAPTHLEVPSGSILPLELFRRRAPRRADAGRSAAGDVRCDRDAHGGGAASVGDAATAVARSSAGRAGDEGSRRVLAADLCDVKKDLKGRYHPKHHCPTTLLSGPLPRHGRSGGGRERGIARGPGRRSHRRLTRRPPRAASRAPTTASRPRRAPRARRRPGPSPPRRRPSDRAHRGSDRRASIRNAAISRLPARSRGSVSSARFSLKDSLRARSRAGRARLGLGARRGVGPDGGLRVHALPSLRDHVGIAAGVFDPAPFALCSRSRS